MGLSGQLQELGWIQCNPTLPDFKMQMSSRYPTGMSDLCNLCTTQNHFAYLNIESVGMRVSCHNVITMIYFDHITIGGVKPSEYHDPTSSSNN